MATNGKKGDGHRNGAVKNRVQILNPQNKRMIKFNTIDGKIMDIKQKLGTKFKGVREK